MALLRDTEIKTLIYALEPLTQDIPLDLLETSRSPVKGASLDLTVGHIYVPGKGKGERGGFDDPLDQIALLQGHMVTKAGITPWQTIASVSKASTRGIGVFRWKNTRSYSPFASRPGGSMSATRHSVGNSQRASNGGIVLGYWALDGIRASPCVLA
jgi:hypothetical protein